MVTREQSSIKNWTNESVSTLSSEHHLQLFGEECTYLPFSFFNFFFDDVQSDFSFIKFIKAGHPLRYHLYLSSEIWEYENI